MPDKSERPVDSDPLDGTRCLVDRNQFGANGAVVEEGLYCYWRWVKTSDQGNAPRARAEEGA
jgi:hypothetical protein